jgi:hypothetical protein
MTKQEFLTVGFGVFGEASARRVGVKNDDNLIGLDELGVVSLGDSGNWRKRLSM